MSRISRRTSSRKSRERRKSVSRKSASRKSRKIASRKKQRSLSRKIVSPKPKKSKKTKSASPKSPRTVYVYNDDELYTKRSEQIGNVMGKKINNQASAEILDYTGEMLIKEVLRICNSRLHRMYAEDITCSDLSEACEYISPLLSIEPKGSVDRKDTLYIVRLLKPRTDNVTNIRLPVLKCFTYLLRNFFHLLVGNVKSLTHKNIKERMNHLPMEIDDLVKSISKY